MPLRITHPHYSNHMEGSGQVCRNIVRAVIHCEMWQRNVVAYAAFSQDVRIGVLLDLPRLASFYRG